MRNYITLFCGMKLFINVLNLLLVYHISLSKWGHKRVKLLRPSDAFTCWGIKTPNCGANAKFMSMELPIKE